MQLSLTPVLFSNAGGGILIEKPEKYRVEEITKRWIAKKKKKKMDSLLFLIFGATE